MYGADTAHRFARRGANVARTRLGGWCCHRRQDDVPLPISRFFRHARQSCRRTGTLLRHHTPLFGRFLGETPIGTGSLAGLSTLAVVAAFSDRNGGLYRALMGQCGRQDDRPACSLMSMPSGRFLSMVRIRSVGPAALPCPALIDAVLPFVPGVVIGNLDHEMKLVPGRAGPGR